MIACQHAKNLFDRYLDGSLSPSLQTELHAHQLSCQSCQTELAILEACGDVIAGDKQEPVLSASFTDRVMLARRAQVRPAKRRWGRTFLVFGSPMAAAASIVFAIILIAPAAKDQPKTVVLGGEGGKVAPPVAVQKALLGGKELPPEVQADLDSTPQMEAVGFVEDWLAPIVAQTRDTFQMAQNGVDQLEVLVRLGASDANSMLVARWQSARQSAQRDQAPVEPTGDAEANEIDLLDPASPRPASPAVEPVSEPEPAQLFDAL